MPRSTPVANSSAVAPATPRTTIASASSTRVRRPDPCRVSTIPESARRSAAFAFMGNVPGRNPRRGSRPVAHPTRTTTPIVVAMQTRQQRGSLVCQVANRQRGDGRVVALRAVPFDGAAAIGLCGRVARPRFRGSRMCHRGGAACLGRPGGRRTHRGLIHAQHAHRALAVITLRHDRRRRRQAGGGRAATRQPPPVTRRQGSWTSRAGDRAGSCRIQRPARRRSSGCASRPPPTGRERSALSWSAPIRHCSRPSSGATRRPVRAREGYVAVAARSPARATRFRPALLAR